MGDEVKEATQKALKETEDAKGVAPGSTTTNPLDFIQNLFSSSTDATATDWGKVAAVVGAGILAVASFASLGIGAWGLVAVGAAGLGLGTLGVYAGWDTIFPPKELKNLGVKRPAVPEPVPEVVTTTDIVLPAYKGVAVSIVELPQYNKTADVGANLHVASNELRKKLEEWYAIARQDRPTGDNAKLRKNTYELDALALAKEVNLRYTRDRFEQAQKGDEKIGTYLKALGMKDADIAPQKLSPDLSNLPGLHSGFSSVAITESEKAINEYGIALMRLQLKGKEDQAEAAWAELSNPKQREIILKAAQEYNTAGMKAKALDHTTLSPGEFMLEDWLGEFAIKKPGALLRTAGDMAVGVTGIGEKSLIGQYDDAIKANDPAKAANVLESIKGVFAKEDPKGSKALRNKIDVHIKGLRAEAALNAMDDYMRNALPQELARLDAFEKNDLPKYEARVAELSQNLAQMQTDGIFIISADKEKGVYRVFDANHQKTLTIEKKAEEKGKSVSYHVSEDGKPAKPITVPAGSGTNVRGMLSKIISQYTIAGAVTFQVPQLPENMRGTGPGPTPDDLFPTAPTTPNVANGNELA